MDAAARTDLRALPVPHAATAKMDHAEGPSAPLVTGLQGKATDQVPIVPMASTAERAGPQDAAAVAVRPSRPTRFIAGC